MSNATMGNPFPYLICAAGNAIFCSGEKEMSSGVFCVSFLSFFFHTELLKTNISLCFVFRFFWSYSSHWPQLVSPESRQ